MAVTDVTTGFGPTKILTLKDRSGNTFKVWGSKALNEAIGDKWAEKGDGSLFVKCLGKSEKKFADIENIAIDMFIFYKRPAELAYILPFLELCKRGSFPDGQELTSTTSKNLSIFSIKSRREVRITELRVLYQEQRDAI